MARQPMAVGRTSLAAPLKGAALAGRTPHLPGTVI